MRLVAWLPVLAITFLGACGGGGPKMRAADGEFFIGAEAGPSANGLAFATGAELLSDLEGQAMQVRLARFVHDVSDGTTDLVVSEETVVLPPGFADLGNRDVFLTLDGVPLIFDAGRAVLPSGQRIWAFSNRALAASGTAGIYTYEIYDPSAGADSIDLEGYFAYGWETDPAVVAGRAGTANYVGAFYGYGQRLALDGAVENREVAALGAVVFEADFARMEISGQLETQLDPGGDAIAFDLVFVDAPIVGNGFVGAPDMVCDPGMACTSATSVGGAFYGGNAEEISGVIGFDETVADPATGEGYRFLGAAGFSAAQETE